MAGRSSLVPTPDTSFAGHQSSLEENLDGHRYLAPEIQWPEDYNMEKVVVTKESDVYGMAMVIYKARSHRSIPPSRKFVSHVNFLGFDGEKSLRRLQR
jgi:hypothetical protein